MTGTVRLNLGVPVQRFSVTVQHATPRVPNALEAALIHILVRLGGLPHYSERTLVHMFTEMLCIPQPALWLAPMLQELTDIRLLTCKRNLDDVSAIVLGDLALTERGQVMISNGKLLGRPQLIKFAWCWDPVALEVRNAQHWDRLIKQAPALALPADFYQDMFPMDAFRVDLVSASWYRDGETEIEAVTVSVGSEVGWELVSVDAVLEGTRLACSTARPAVHQYLQDQRDPQITGRLAAAMFGEAYADFDDWEQVISSDSERFISLAQLAERLGVAPEAAFDNVALNLFDGIEEAPAGGLRVHYADTSEPPEAELGAEGEYIIVSGQAMLASECSVVVDGHTWRLCRVAVQIGRATVAVPVALQVQRSQSVADAALAHSLLETRQATQIGAALRLDAATAWPVLLHGLRGANRGKACLDVVLAWMVEMVRHNPRAAAVLDRTVLQDVFAQALREHGRIDAAGELTTWRIALQALEPPVPRAALEQLLEAAYPAVSIVALHGMTGEARLVAKDYCIPYSPASYGKPLVAELLALGSLDGVERALRNPNPFERQLRAVWRDGVALGRLLGTPFPVTAPAPQTMEKILRERKSDACIGAIGQWRELLDGLYRLAQVDVPEPASPLEASRISLQAWEEELVRAAANASGHFDYVFVSDTNALINLPELPLKMTGNVLLVVPQVVLDELDRKKRDPALTQVCNRAVRLLLEMPAARRRFEESDLARLPADFEDSPDNRILSVAMKYHHPNLRLVTDDTILFAKAESMKIIAVKIDRFGASHAARAQPPRQGGKPGQHKKGQAA
ncbi:PIN domain-containing protein [Janthinobacterium sp. 78]|uniref:PIN domain-containing protein n=1 Tax=Janthinobacterium sp. 78 TaxID=2135631 RepID=UPI000D5F2704|nr:PIN domain-containing protein [Janthinobacterium sp. 78]PVX38189.1 PIN domain-containing protein [Janthinobacterium sp. 78]